MPKRLVLVLVALLGLAVVSAGPSSAQPGADTMGGTSQHCIQPITNTDLSPASGFDFGLSTWFRFQVTSTFSWGRWTTGRPGWLRSSTAVLRERRGAMPR